jgi:hypothetical protein
VTSTPFHTAIFDHRVPGESADMSAVSYNLQYTKPLVDEFVRKNPAGSPDLHTVRLDKQELVRADLYGQDPNDETRRICVIGVGDGEERAVGAASNAWFDYHASVLFTDAVGEGRMHNVSIHRPVPGAPAQRATTVGVLYDLDYMRPQVEAAVARNAPTNDECQVVQSGEMTLMRVNLYGLHPLESNRRICVGGIADRHYRGVAAAEQAWSKYHATLLFGAQALGSR